MDTECTKTEYWLPNIKTTDNKHYFRSFHITFIRKVFHLFTYTSIMTRFISMMTEFEYCRPRSFQPDNRWKSPCPVQTLHWPDKIAERYRAAMWSYVLLKTWRPVQSFKNFYHGELYSHMPTQPVPELVSSALRETFTTAVINGIAHYQKKIIIKTKTRS